MKKMPLDFYSEMNALRDRYGAKEYSRDELLPAAMALVKKYVADDKALLRQATEDILDSLERSEDAARQGGLFSYDGQVALGEKRRIKRGAMNLDQHNRRKRILDHNFTAQSKAWSAETEWLNAGIDALTDKAPATKREAVLDEGGIGVKKKKA